MAKQLEHKKLKAIELLAAGSATYTDIAEECGITTRTLFRWRKDPEFVEAVVDRARELLKETLPGIYNVLSEEAMTGSYNHIKLVLDHLHKLEEMQQIAAEGNITFTWGKQENNE